MTPSGRTEPATEAVSPRYADLETWPPLSVMQALWEGQLAAVAAVQPALPALAEATTAAARRLRRGGRLAYAGAGTSGRIGVQDGAELGPTFDWPTDRLVFLMAGGQQALVRAAENAVRIQVTVRLVAANLMHLQPLQHLRTPQRRPTDAPGQLYLLTP